MSTDAEDLLAWKQVHQQLINAVLIAKDAVAIQKAQRRYWLTEINANLTPEGKLVPTSVWKRPIRKIGKRTPKPDTKPKVKRKRKKDTAGEDKPAKKARESKKKAADDDDDDDDDDEPLVKPKKKLKLHLEPPSAQEDHPQEEDTEEEEGQQHAQEQGQEEEDESEDEHEGSFLTAAPGFASGQQWGSQSAGMAVIASAADFNADATADTADGTTGYSSFLPSNSYILDQSRYGEHGFAALQGHDDESDEDTEEDDY